MLVCVVKMLDVCKSVPNSQKATMTFMSGCLRMARILEE